MKNSLNYLFYRFFFINQIYELVANFYSSEQRKNIINVYKEFKICGSVTLTHTNEAIIQKILIILTYG